MLDRTFPLRFLCNNTEQQQRQQHTLQRESSVKAMGHQSGSVTGGEKYFSRILFLNFGVFSWYLRSIQLMVFAKYSPFERLYEPKKVI